MIVSFKVFIFKYNIVTTCIILNKFFARIYLTLIILGGEGGRGKVDPCDVKLVKSACAANIISLVHDIYLKIQFEIFFLTNKRYDQPAPSPKYN